VEAKYVDAGSAVADGGKRARRPLHEFVGNETLSGGVDENELVNAES
jgi:hypothetical protein